MTLNVLMASSAIAGFAGVACAAPIAKELPDRTTEFALQDADPGLPPIGIQKQSVSLGPGAGSTTTVAISPTDGFACPAPSPFEPLSAYEVEASYDSLAGSGFGDVIGDGTPGWEVADFACGFFADTYQILYEPPFDFVCSDCEQTVLSFASPLGAGIAVLPVRTRLVGASAWTYGWIALDIVTGIQDTDCTPFPKCGGGDTGFYDEFFYAGFGFESEAGVPIVAGGGLCRADLVPDAVLDFADVQAFINAFTGRDAAGDFDGNGSFDLADILRFIVLFNDGCGIL